MVSEKMGLPFYRRRGRRGRRGRGLGAGIILNQELT